MKQIANDIMNITSGVIVHQVNCQNRIGAGIFGVIIKKYPSVEKAYHWIFTQMTKLHNFPMEIQKNQEKFIQIPMLSFMH